MRRLRPILADGTDASVIQTTTFGLGTNTACGDFAVPEFDDPELEEITCFVAATETDQAVTGVRYDTTGQFTFVAPTNNPVEFTGLAIVRVEDGKIVEAWNEFDFMKMYAQVGALQLNLSPGTDG